MPPAPENSSMPSCGVISAELTKGMSRIEVFVVLFAAHASEKELERLRDFFNSYEPERHKTQPTQRKS